MVTAFAASAPSSASSTTTATPMPCAVSSQSSSAAASSSSTTCRTSSPTTPSSTAACAPLAGHPSPRRTCSSCTLRKRTTLSSQLDPRISRSTCASSRDARTCSPPLWRGRNTRYRATSTQRTSDSCRAMLLRAPPPARTEGLKLRFPIMCASAGALCQRGTAGGLHPSNVKPRTSRWLTCEMP
uniref:Uncharacterized protein n=1 Tax=Ixodes ricinus TaxID=34613 RepID=A0A147BFR6_IXORI